MNSIRLAIFWGTLAWAEAGDVDKSSCNISLPWTVSKTDYTDVSDTVFESLFQCPGDLNGCGDRTLLTCQQATYVRTCSCASNCRVYRDCCWETGIDKAEADFPESCCVVVDLYESVRKFLYMVTGCLPSWPNDDVREACEKPGHFNETFYQIPVTSSSDITYKNGYCALCNYDLVVVFSIYKDARSFSSKCTLCLSITLLMTQLVFLLVNSFKVSRAVCTASAMLVHYGFLSTFFWTSVLSFDIWRGITAVNLSSTRKRTLALYCVVAWGAPMIIVTVAAMVNWLAPTSLVSPLYGVSSCWIGSIWAQITYFLAPMAVLLVIGIVLYLNTVFYIRKTTGHARDFEFKDGVQQNQHSHMALYVRLALIMGATWGVGFLGVFVDSTVTDILVIVLVGLQGVYLFFAFKDHKHFCSSISKRKISSSAVGQSNGTFSTEEPQSKRLSL
ncbi:G-protein coupled receptor Mth2 [Ixodes scapularis]